MESDQGSSLKHLGKSGQYSYEEPDPKVLDTFPNPGVGTVQMTCREFTFLCPVTGQPDHGEIMIHYRPGKKCLESKSLKLYLGAYRMFRGFTEAITQKICEDICSALEPQSIQVQLESTWRGGIKIAANHGKRQKPGLSSNRYESV